MAEVFVSALDSSGNPRCYVRLERFEIVKGNEVNRLVIRLGRETIKVWPVTPALVKELISDLEKVGSKLNNGS